jgi:hypothetical protein
MGLSAETFWGIDSNIRYAFAKAKELVKLVRQEHSSLYYLRPSDAVFCLHTVDGGSP